MSAEAWQLLGLAPTDDVRAIKRAYAAKLKRCRPEDDAQGFARLRNAYDYLLARVALHGNPRTFAPVVAAASVESPPVTVEVPVAPLEPATPAPARSRAEPSVQVARSSQHIAADVLVQAQQAQGHDATAAFARWLAADPELMLLDRKPLVSRAVLAGIVRGQPPMPAAFAVLQEFFHWDDRLEQRRLAQVGLSIEEAMAQVEAAEMRRVMAYGVSRRFPLERGLEAARRAGDGWRAWWLAISRRRQHSVPVQLQRAIKLHGYRAVEQVFGAATLAFWQRALTPRPTRLQWAIGLGQGLLLGLLVCVAGLAVCSILLLLRLAAGDEHLTLDPLAPVAGGMLWAGLFTAVVGCLLNVWQLSLRWATLGPVPVLRNKLVLLRQRLGLDRQPLRALVAAALLLVLAWYWPAQLDGSPYLVLVGALLLLYLRDLRSVLGPCFVAIGALALFSSHDPPLLLMAGTMPLSLWLGNAGHDILQRRRVGTLRCGTVVMLCGLVISVLLLLLSAGLGLL